MSFTHNTYTLHTLYNQGQANTFVWPEIYPRRVTYKHHDKHPLPSSLLLNTISPPIIPTGYTQTSDLSQVTLSDPSIIYAVLFGSETPVAFQQFVLDQSTNPLRRAWTSPVLRNGRHSKAKRCQRRSIAHSLIADKPTVLLTNHAYKIEGEVACSTGHTPTMILEEAENTIPLDHADSRLGTMVNNLTSQGVGEIIEWFVREPSEDRYAVEVIKVLHRCTDLADSSPIEFFAYYALGPHITFPLSMDDLYVGNSICLRGNVVDYNHANNTWEIEKKPTTTRPTPTSITVNHTFCLSPIAYGSPFSILAITLSLYVFACKYPL